MMKQQLMNPIDKMYKLRTSATLAPIPMYYAGVLRSCGASFEIIKHL